MQVTIESLAPGSPSDGALGLPGMNPMDDAGQGILLYPGEPSEILLRIENISDRACFWSWSFGEDTNRQVREWCDTAPDQPQMIGARETVEYAIGFVVPGDFFEAEDAISVSQKRLKLEYKVDIVVNSVQNNHDITLIGYQFFNVYIQPQVSFLDFLPAFYGESDFLRRFLCIFEQAFQPYIDTIEHLWAYLDPLTAPEALLPFLAHWVAWKIEPDWNIDMQRRLIRNAMELYRWHGTRYGLRFYLHLYTGLPLDDSHIAVDEEFEGGFTFGDCQMGDNALFGGGRGYHFIIKLRWDSEVDMPDSNDRICSIIDQQKPAFCTYDLVCESL
jgi:phage tail-like protein